MNELKPEDVRMELAWYEVVGKNIGSVTVPYDEIKAIANLLREKDAEIEEWRMKFKCVKLGKTKVEAENETLKAEIERLEIELEIFR